MTEQIVLLMGRSKAPRILKQRVEFVLEYVLSCPELRKSKYVFGNKI